MQRDTKIKMISTGIFLTVLLGVSYLVYHSNEIKTDLIISSFKISGNNLLNENDYLTFTRLNKSENKNLTLPVIKSRFEKHPYVLKADVELINENIVRVFLTEKKIYGVIINNGETFFAAENFQLLPVFQNTRMINIPVLSNPGGDFDFKVLNELNNNDIMHAYRLIDALNLTNKKMFNNLAEINLRDGGDIILTFSGLSIPVVFGRNNEVQKLVSLEAILNNYLADESDYIDLRFYNNIYIGYTQRVEL